jgi:hypothetical protein
MAHRCASRVALAFSTIALTLASGCGSSTDTTPTPYLNISGNWYIVGPTPTSSTLLPPIVSFYGALESSGSAVSGTFHVVPTSPSAPFTPCVSIYQDIPVTGTIDAANNLTLNATIAGGAATLQATLTQDLQAFSSGAYSIVGGACAMPSTSMFTYQIPPITGTYSGALTNTFVTPAVTTTVTAQLTQSTTPTADGFFPLSGTISIAGGCPASVSFSGEYVEGPSIEEGTAAGLEGNILPPFPSSPTLTINATVAAVSQTCPQIVSIWSGTLTPQ